MAKVTIDGIEVEVKDGTNIIEAAKAADVHVPHFCYHPSLEVVGQCRMCLVEIEGVPKLQAGCSTTVRDGMSIFVHNDKVDKARKGQMEFLLINHPLDCPICDKAGECPLQDYAFNFGSVTSRFEDSKRTYTGMDRTSIGPHVLQNMNRCIHCTRCIRFCQEITETGELAFFKRGAETEVGVFPGRPIDNWMSACVTDLCPTGALTTREFRFESRVWNLESTESVCNGCDIGCNLFIEHRSSSIHRYKPRVNEEVNDHWLCDYGRFSHEKFETARAVVPKVRHDDFLCVATWSEVWEELVEILGKATADGIAVIASAQLTNEEGFLLRKIFAEALGTRNLDVFVDAIGPMRMKSRSSWLEGSQGGPNMRGLRAVGVRPGDGGRTAESLMNDGANGLDLLWIADVSFSERARDPRVVDNLRKARTLIVHSWEDHPLADAADIVLPSAIFAEKSGTWTNVQNRIQRIRQAYLPKGEARSDFDILRRVGSIVSPDDNTYQITDPEELFSKMVESVPGLSGIEWDEVLGTGIFPGHASQAPAGEKSGVDQQP